MVVWDDEENPIILIVDGWKLHLIVSATTPRAQHFENLAFDGEQVPQQVLEAIPTN